MLGVPALVTVNNNIQAIILKSMDLDSEWFKGDQIKIENWWKGTQLYLKSNRIIETNNRITVILSYLREDVVGIYTQKKLDELDEEPGIQDWDNFVKEIKTTFSDKTKAVHTKWRIEFFKQEKKNMADFIIEFEVLAIKTDIDELYAIFLLKKNVRQDIIKTILEYLSIVAPETLKE